MWSVLDKIVILLWSWESEWGRTAPGWAGADRYDFNIPAGPHAGPHTTRRRISKQNILALLHPAPGWLVVDRRDVCCTVHSVLEGGWGWSH